MTGTNPVKTSFVEPERPLDGFEKKIDDGASETWSYDPPSNGSQS